MEISESITELQKGFRMFKAFEKAVEVSKALEAIEGAIREKNAMLEALNGEVEKLAEMKDSALSFAANIKDSAVAQAKTTVSRAEEMATGLLDSAKATAEKVVSEAKKEAEKHANVADDLGAANVKMNAALAAGAAELAAIRNAVEAHKQEISKFVKG